MNTIDYRPNLLRSAVGIAVMFTFGIVFAILTTIAVPFSKRLAYMFPRLWGRWWVGSVGLRVNVRGLERIDSSKRYVFVSNHQSGLDIPLLYTVLRDHGLNFVSKKELLYIPIFGWGMYAIGHVSLDRGNPRKAHASVVRAAQRIRTGGGSLAIFPEGTRSSDGTLQAFKTGLFRLAIETGLDIVPIAIDGACKVLPKHALLYRPGPVTVTIGEPIALSGAGKAEKADLAARSRAAIATMLGQEVATQVSADDD